MKLELSNNTLYLIYCKKRDTLPLCYCIKRFQYPYCEGGVNMLQTVEKGGFYKYEETSDGNIRVYDTYLGLLLSKYNFDSFFKKPSKLRLFLHKLMWL